MSLIVIESTATTVNGGYNPTLTITKPTGLTVGDLMVFIGSIGQGGTTSSLTIDLPAGWTSATSTNATSGCGSAIHYKVADSSDVAVSNFSWTTSGGTFTIGGAILRCSNYFTTHILEGSFSAGTAAAAVDTTFNLSGTATVGVPNDLVVLAFGAGDPQNGSPASVSAYASTPSMTWTELYDGGGFTTNSCASGAYAINTTSTNVTNVQGTLSNGFDNHCVSVATFRSYYPISGENTLVSVNSQTFSQGGMADTRVGNAVTETDTTVFTQSGKGTTPQQWVNEAKPTTSWDNETP